MGSTDPIQTLHSLSFTLESTDEAKATIEDHTVIVRHHWTGKKRRKYTHYTIEIDGVPFPHNKYLLDNVCYEINKRFPSFNHTQRIWDDIGD